ncbi:DEAD/DEAH box helicase family protein [Fibrobacter intestinalis]|uniref:Type III restriction enzyme, res subunit n=1 Tax=Fibrobacter intestinalis TaxID=28122 RepID=A0A1T4S1Y3_9BACT|nr:MULTISPECIES: DEAD/DEAH box helicase family protein [Fibrobacter]SKA22243.1 Type III restriction enzyme, res subunit [Fibrobacter intestinalis]
MEQKVSSAQLHHEILPAYENETSDEDVPRQSKQAVFPKIEAPLPSKIDIVLSNQIFIDYTGLPAILRNRILRLASFQNPEFYQAQALRLPVWGKPRILYCYDIQAKYIGLPIGCLDKLTELLAHYKIKPIIQDERNVGTSIDAEFQGTLYPEQMLAAEALLKDDFGVLSATTAFGKTVVALWLIAQRKVNTLILVHRAQLMEQWVERITEFLGIPKKKSDRLVAQRKSALGRLMLPLLRVSAGKAAWKNG